MSGNLPNPWDEVTNLTPTHLQDELSEVVSQVRGDETASMDLVIIAAARWLMKCALDGRVALRPVDYQRIEKLSERHDFRGMHTNTADSIVRIVIDEYPDEY